MKSYTCCLLFALNARLISGATMTLSAQQTIREGTYTIAGNTYKISKLNEYKEYVIGNVDKSALKPNPLEVNGFASEYIRTKMTNEKELQKLICEALGKEKREKLAAAKEKISGWINYRADGSVINMVFGIKENTVLVLDDLVRIECTLQERFKANFESQPPNFHLHLYHISLGYEWDFGK